MEPYPNMNMKKRYSLVGLAAVLVAGACNDLNVTNPNNPDVARALASPDDVKALAQSTVRSWYMTTVSAGPDDLGDLAPYHWGAVTSDVLTGRSEEGRVGVGVESKMSAGCVDH